MSSYLIINIRGLNSIKGVQLILQSARFACERHGFNFLHLHCIYLFQDSNLSHYFFFLFKYLDSLVLFLTCEFILCPRLHTSFVHAFKASSLDSNIDLIKKFHSIWGSSTSLTKVKFTHVHCGHYAPLIGLAN